VLQNLFNLSAQLANLAFSVLRNSVDILSRLEVIMYGAIRSDYEAVHHSLSTNSDSVRSIPDRVEEAIDIDALEGAQGFFNWWLFVSTGLGISRKGANHQEFPGLVY
jgi:hypothetical protein